MRAETSPTAVYESFDTAFPEQAHGPNSKPKGYDAKRDRAVREAIRRINRQGWEVVTVVNLHGFQLDLPMGYLGHLTIPPKKQGDLYALKVIDQPKIDMKDLGDGNFEPIPVMPKELAEDLINNFQETGGVFWYLGTGKVPEDLLESAQRAQLEWYWILFQEGNANWAQFNKNPKQITDRMRDAAKELWRLKLINVQPEWITVTKNESPDRPCEGCGNVIQKVAAFCAHCETIYNPEWVKAKRPDIWARQNPNAGALSREVSIQAGGTSVDKPDIDKFIADEEEVDKPKTKRK